MSIDGESLEQSWTATITVRRQSQKDVGYREIFLLLDGETIGVLRHRDMLTREVQPGAHRLQVHNTLFKKTLEFTLEGSVSVWRQTETLPARARGGALTQDVRYSRPLALGLGLRAVGA